MAAVGRTTGHRADLDPACPREGQKEPSVGQGDDVVDMAGASDRIDLGGPLVVGLVARLQESEREGPVPLESIPHEAAVAWLEDMERQGGAREQDDTRQREDAEDALHGLLLDPAQRADAGGLADAACGE